MVSCGRRGWFVCCCHHGAEHNVSQPIEFTHWPMGDWNEILIINFRPQMKVTWPWLVNIDSCNGLGPAGSNLLPEPMLSQSHMAPQDHHVYFITDKAIAMTNSIFFISLKCVLFAQFLFPWLLLLTPHREPHHGRCVHRTANCKALRVWRRSSASHKDIHQAPSHYLSQC